MFFISLKYLIIKDLYPSLGKGTLLYSHAVYKLAIENMAIFAPHSNFFCLFDIWVYWFSNKDWLVKKYLLKILKLPFSRYNSESEIVCSSI